MTLNDAKLNLKYTIKSVNLEDRQRLLELGFIPNKKITKLYESFDKKMVAIKIDGTIISLRKNICNKIIVKEGE